MDGQNKLFKSNVASYLRSHSIIVPSSFTDLGRRRLTNGRAYMFDLQIMAANGVRVRAEVGTNLVILTLLAHRGRAERFWTSGIYAMWLGNASDIHSTSHPLPTDANYVFTQNLGGCSVYIQNNEIVHDYHGNVPASIPQSKRAAPRYRDTSDYYGQTCAVAYKAGSGTAAEWRVDTSMPHSAGGSEKTHEASGYKYRGHY